MNVVIACCAGMSSSMIMEAMYQHCQRVGKQISIDVMSVDGLESSSLEYDVILLGPQTRMSKKRLEKRFTLTPVGVLPDEVYARIDGKQAVLFAEKLYEQRGR